MDISEMFQVFNLSLIKYPHKIILEWTKLISLYQSTSKICIHLLAKQSVLNTLYEKRACVF